MTEIQYGNRLTGWRLLLGRMLWAIAFLLCVTFLLALVPIITRLTEEEWQVVTSYPVVSSIITYSGYIRYLLVMRYFALGMFFVAAFFIFWRRSHDGIALLASATLLLIPTAFFFSIEYPPYSPPWGAILENMGGLILVSTIVCMILFFNLFPDGNFPLPKMTVWILLSIAVIFALIILVYVNAGELFWGLFTAVIVGVLLASVFAQIHRYRHLSSSAQRQQIKWVLFAFSISAGGFLGQVLLSSVPVSFLSEAQRMFFNLHLGLVIMSSIPVSMVISIFRYRLWDIDVIIRRTLIYGSLSATLLALYLISVVSFQSLISALGFPKSEAAIIVSTLVIAALFNPLRRRIQHNIDHRFYREKYDAARELARFAVVARDETNIDRLRNELLLVVQETVQPEAISLWVRKADE